MLPPLGGVLQLLVVLITLALCCSIRELNLAPVMGGWHNYDELLALISTMEDITWTKVSECNHSRCSPCGDLYSGREDFGGGFVWYDPWSRKVVDYDTSKAQRKLEREVPGGLPYGYVFLADPTVSGIHPNIVYDSPNPDLGSVPITGDEGPDEAGDSEYIHGDADEDFEEGQPRGLLPLSMSPGG